MKSCCLCGHTFFTDIFDLGPLPLGFPLDLDLRANENVWENNYKLVLCNNCLLGQTINKVPDEQLKTENSYLSKRVKIVSDHDRHFSQLIPTLLSLPKDSLIMEIGCGDGSLLEQFKKSGYSNLLGVEPSPRKADFPFDIITDYFNSKVAKRLKTQNKLPDLVIANYVLELVPDLQKILENLADLMKDGSFLVIEVPYLNSFLKNFRLDGFAHLRCNWFTMESLLWAFRKYGFKVIDLVHDENYRGGTLQAIVEKGSVDHLISSDNHSERLKQEKIELSSPLLKSLRMRIKSYCDFIPEKINELIENGITLYGYGGGLKASTIVNMFGFTSSQITMTFDIDPNKQNKVIPLANIPIRSIEQLFNEKNVDIGVIILAIDHLIEVEDFLKARLKKGSLLIHIIPEYKAVKI